MQESSAGKLTQVRFKVDVHRYLGAKAPLLVLLLPHLGQRLANLFAQSHSQGNRYCVAYLAQLLSKELSRCESESCA